MAKTHLNLFDIKGFSMENEGLGLIIKLQEYGALTKEIKCIRGHIMRLVHDQTVLDKYKWICREKINSKKKTTCNYR